MNVAEWLNGLTCVAPFTVSDAGELYSTLKSELGKQSVVDVYITTDVSRKQPGEEVHVTINSPTLKYERTYVVTHQG